MEIEESRTFKINRKHFRPQSSRQACGLTSKTFEVTKSYGDIEADFWGPIHPLYFYAISGRTGFNEVRNGNSTHKYESQVAYIRYKYGWIDILKVCEQSLEEYEGVGPWLNARGC